MTDKTAQKWPPPADYDALARDWYYFTKMVVGAKGRLAYQDVPDVVQTIFTRAWKSQILDKYNPDYGPFSNFWMIYVLRSIRGIQEQMWIEAPRWPVTEDGIVPEAKPHRDRTLERILAAEEYHEFRAYLSSIKRQGKNSPPWEDVLDAIAEVFLADIDYYPSLVGDIDIAMVAERLGLKYPTALDAVRTVQKRAEQWRTRRRLELREPAT